jgi:hypothetical protein
LTVWERLSAPACGERFTPYVAAKALLEGPQSCARFRLGVVSLLRESAPECCGRNSSNAGHRDP